MEKTHSLRYYFMAIFFILLMTTSTLAENYYVDNESGNDSHSGTSPILAWRTLDKVNSFSFSPGDTVHFKRGQIFRGELIISSSGMSKKPLTFKHYGSKGYASITPSIGVKEPRSAWEHIGNRIWRRSFETQSNLMIFNDGILGVWNKTPGAAYEFFWENGYLFVWSPKNPAVHYTGLLSAGGESAISVRGGRHIVISDLKIFGGQLSGSMGSTGSGGGIFIDQSASDVSIRNVIIKECHGGGIRIRGADNIVIDGCDISNITAHIGIIPGGTSGDAVEINWEGQTKKSPRHILISNNTIHGFIDRNGISILSGSQITIRDNTIITRGSLCGIDLEPVINSEQIIEHVLICGNDIEVTGDFDHKPDGISAYAHNMNEVDILWNTIHLSGGVNGPMLGILVGNSTQRTTLTRTIIMGNTVEGAEDGIRIGEQVDGRITRNFVQTPKDGLVGLRVVNGGKGLFFYNIVSGFQTGAGVMGEKSSMELYNNTFFNYGVSAMETGDFQLSIKARNNIFYTSSSNSLVRHIRKFDRAAVDIDFNTYYPGHILFFWNGMDKHLSDIKSVPVVQETNGLIANPSFRNDSGEFRDALDFDLSVKSSLFDRGVRLEFDEDYTGKIVPVNLKPDMGAFERSARHIIAFFMDELSGIIVHDTSGNASHGRIANGATLTPDGKMNGGVEFLGGTCVLKVPHRASMNTDRITMAAFIHQKIRSLGARVIDRGAYLLYVKKDGTAVMALKINGKYHYVKSNSTVPLHAWTHLAGSYDGKKMTLFMDGEAVGKNIIYGKIAHDSSKLSIGNTESLKRGFIGMIDEVMILSEPISQSDLFRLIDP